MSIAISTLAFFLFFNTHLGHSLTNDFVYNGFLGASLSRDEASIITSNGALQLTNQSQNIIGHAFYSTPLRMLNKNSSSAANIASSFSTSFVFAIVPPSPDGGGHGFAFTLSPSKQFPMAEHSQYLGLLDQSNDGKSSNHIFAVEFDISNGYEKFADVDANHVGININGISSKASKPATYVNGTGENEEVKLDSGRSIQAWIEYDGVKKVVNVSIAPSSTPKPSQPLLVYSFDLSLVLEESMYVGFSASTGKLTSSQYILGWSFNMNGVSRSLDLSQLPSVPPHEGNGSSSKLNSTTIIAIVSSVLVLFFLALVASVALYRRATRSEDLEDWELHCSHRFRFKDLYVATKGFKQSEVIGVGGFGVVYKGVLPSTGEEVAVKKISQEGTREFVAEVESLGRLRHKHLIYLQGWCKRKGNLLLVYDYIPNGSLDNLLFNPINNFVLSWEQRFKVLKDIASGLLYLHEEWEQVVVHRDVKASNVLLDADMNGRLGDFGLARLYNHGNNPSTTIVVGTLGYMAPELARTGKASPSSDVFAYGALLLEVACGRRPLDPNYGSGQIILLDWVSECDREGRILDAVDPKIESSYVREEMELVLRLGLVCSRLVPEVRPSMRQVTRYLNGDESLPFDGLAGSDYHRLRVDEMNSIFLDIISRDEINKSYHSSSFGGASYRSLEAGR
ncbi:hypothetical protein HHK36_018816 [Tetracentron sinense]|uniref:non-specific serine/threonine protein kinase n=1 Tax=Tetracentron sinense TaxID=13715 RepID=A0A835DC78_TETSI|nr:hypothetical protein HHK36_018816 [Tetracentron sinense]